MKKNSRLTSVLGVFFIIAIIASILLLGNRTIDPKLVDARLQQFADALTRDGKKAGRDVTLTHGAVSIEGVGYDKYVMIPDMRLTVAGAADADNWSLATGKVKVVINPLNNQQLVFKFLDPFTLSRHGTDTVITLGKPLNVGYVENPENKETFLNINLQQQLLLSTQPPLSVSYDRFPDISIKTVAAEKKTSYQIRNIIVQSGGEQAVTIGSLVNDISEKMSDDSHASGHFRLTLSDFTLQQEGKKTETCSFAADIDYDSTLPLFSWLGPPRAAKIDGKLNKLAMACDNFNVKLTGNFSRATGGAFVSSNFDVAIDNPQALLASTWLSDQTRSQLVDALPKITGKPLDGQQSITFPVKRDSAGKIMTGEINFDDTGITILKTDPQPEPATPEGTN